MTESPVSLITGGSTGIGAATARKLLDRGHRVAVTARRKERLDSFAASVASPDRLLTIPGDAAEVDDVRSAVAATLERFGRIDTAIANAGYATFDSVTDGDPEGWRHMVLTNVLGPMLLANAVIPALRRSRGRIVMVGSVAGLVHTPGNVYGATKWAVTGLAENTRRAVTDDGIGVTLVAPGRVETNFWEAGGDGPPAGLNLTDDQLADTIVFAATQPAGVDVNTLVVRPVGQPV
ncbi:NADP-dependent 3-hydroxy acid dehydrogenase YdfG [Stackebrandtia endophytica]|uniref:NADP-dependent 3-hydroxy acid dehydrogenase YdfG n=1 Tax=Stackebrandtia endophytica TaxID=1496996 RepID=A0A543AZ56_9ACTN|nr:SDR family oxidoreductase [Stackebrandtia endophytica]TQL77865.1 NADP-dependent 3-hydroxy acid dehydrogenase YdfG [Stackebrandtia endophytica]